MQQQDVDCFHYQVAESVAAKLPGNPVPVRRAQIPTMIRVRKRQEGNPSGSVSSSPSKQHAPAIWSRVSAASYGES